MAAKPKSPFGEGSAADLKVEEPPPAAPPPPPVSMKTVQPGSLIPDLTAIKAEERVTSYWFGLTPDCPVDPVHIGGVTFAKMMEIVSIGPNGETIREPRLGCCALLTKRSVEAVAKNISRLVVRITKRQIGGDINPNLEDIEDKERRIITTGHMIRIPTEEERDAMRDRGSLRSYVPTEADTPAAQYVYMIPSPQRGTEIPDTVMTTGIQIPEE